MKSEQVNQDLIRQPQGSQTPAKDIDNSKRYMEEDGFKFSQAHLANLKASYEKYNYLSSTKWC